MALMLRETVNETSGEDPSHFGGSSIGNTAIGGMSNAMVPYTNTNPTDM